MKKLFGLAALFAAFGFATAFVGCSSGTDVLPVVIVTPGDSSSGGGQTTPTTDNGGGQQTGGGSGGGQSVVAASGDYKKVDTVDINGVEYDIVTFGLWPQTIKADSVTVDTSVTEPHGAFTYCKGSDGEWYVEQAEKAHFSNCKYSDGKAVGQGGTSTKWFKVEPVKWRVLTNSYSGAKLLLAESILTGGVQYYLNTSIHTIGDATVHANNYKYSTIRAWLNGAYEAGDTQDKTHAGKGFLQSAFTAAQQAAIKTTAVDNSAASTTDAGGNITQATEYKCDNTSDKIFLLSEKEVTTSAYGFAAYDEYVGDDSGTTSSTRIRATTDFAKATGAFQIMSAGMGCWWWLRSPWHNNGTDCHVRFVESNGEAGKTRQSSRFERVSERLCREGCAERSEA